MTAATMSMTIRRVLLAYEGHRDLLGHRNVTTTQIHDKRRRRDSQAATAQCSDFLDLPAAKTKADSLNARREAGCYFRVFRLAGV